MIRAQGTTTGTGTSVGWVQGGVNQPGHMATFTTRSTTYTAAAEAAAPPRKRFNGAALLASGVVLGIVLGFIGYTLGTNGSFGTAQLNVGIAAVVGVLMFGAGLVLFPLDFAYNRDVYPASRERWARTWQCLRCGARFLV